jgi:hypothetical protein
VANTSIGVSAGSDTISELADLSASLESLVAQFTVS